MRYDHVSGDGYSRLTSPLLDAFGARSFRFTNAITQAPYTKAAMASVMSGLYPISHKTVTATVPFPETMTGHPTTAAVETDVLASSVTTLAESFQAGGYLTFGYTANPFLIEAFGFAQGFNVFHFFPGGDFETAAVVIDRAMNDVRQARSSAPLFLWLHLMEPHSPYAPGALTRGMFPPEGRPHLIPAASQPPSWLLAGSPQDLRLYESAYDEEIASVDVAVDRLFRQLAEADRFENAVIVVAADHGEQFLDHGGWEHGDTLYDELVHVPLVIRLPSTAGRRIDDQVQLIDLYPTLLQLAGISSSSETSGRSFTDLLSGTHTSEQAFIELPNRAYAVRADGWKCIMFADGHDELYDLSADPAERHNVADAHATRVDALKHIIERHLVSALERGETVGRERAPVDPAILEQLRSLGYLGR
jgi:arylsulfatase A-like enzyme